MVTIAGETAGYVPLKCRVWLTLSPPPPPLLYSQLGICRHPLTSKDLSMPFSLNIPAPLLLAGSVQYGMLWL